MGETSVPKIAWTTTGATAPQETDVLAGVMADMNAAFGGNLNGNLETPQGQIASSGAASIGAKNDEVLLLSNQFDPATASGIWQDALGRIYFLSRIPSAPTVVQVECTGLFGTVIPAGAVVADLDGNRYASTGSGTIGSGGTVTIQFAAVNPGPLVCPSHAITTIYRAIPGWDSVDNDAAGVVGRNAETRAEFELRRQQSVALNSVSRTESIRAVVLAVDGVTDAYVVDNPLGTTATVGGVTLAAHSIYIAVVGGAQSDVAAAIWSKKNPGCNYNGSTTVTVTDSSYSYPQPSYAVSYTIPTPTRIYFDVSIADLPNLPSDIVALVKAAILSAFSGGDGGSRATIGATLFASRFYAPVLKSADVPIEVLSLFVGTSSGPTTTAQAININQVPTLSSADIAVTLV